MDRRAFLKTGGGAAAGVAFAQSAPAAAERGSAARTGTPGLVLRMAMAWAPETPVLGDAALRLAHRIGTASGGRYRVQPIATSRSGIEALRSAEADIYYAPEHQLAQLQPALSYFAGIPARAGLDFLEHQAWLTAGGGQMLWDDLAAELGIKPLLAGVIQHAGFWLARPLAGTSDLRDLTVHVLGLGGEVARRHGARAVCLGVGELASALSVGKVDAVQSLDLLADMALGLPAGARLYARSAAAGWTAVSLGIRRDFWDSLPSPDQAIIEACAAEEVRAGMAEAMAHRRIVRSALASQGVAFGVMPPEIETAFASEWSRVVAELAVGSARAARVAGSYTAFRDLTAELLV